MRKQSLQRMPSASLAPVWVCLGGCGAGMAATAHGSVSPTGGGGARGEEPGEAEPTRGTRSDHVRSPCHGESSHSALLLLSASSLPLNTVCEEKSF